MLAPHLNAHGPASPLLQQTQTLVWGVLCLLNRKWRNALLACIVSFVFEESFPPISRLSCPLNPQRACRGRVSMSWIEEGVMWGRSCLRWT